MILHLLLSLAPMSQPAQEPVADFSVFFDRPGKEIPAGIGTGLNDLGNASEGCWQVWAREVEPSGGLARVWAQYAISGTDQIGQTALYAKAAGLTTMITAVGAPESLPKGLGDEGTGIAPADLGAWTDRVAQDVKRLQAMGVTVSHVEIWNEPNFPGQWHGTEESFAEFFAQSGKMLSAKLPGVKIGGPGMATAAGAAQHFFRKILAACDRAGWAPDFLSWHFYSTFPGDNESCRFGERLLEMARELGLPEPELVLSEWNVDLPNPAKPALDDHRAGVYFAAVNSSLVNTPVVHSQFFFLQDGFWEAKKDYAGESVGVFTLRGGPKAVLQGMRMFNTAAALPAVPVERGEAPWNISCLATRRGDKGYLLLTNAFGVPAKSARHLVDAAGVDLGSYQGKERQLQAWARGRISYEDMGGRPEDKDAWFAARAFLKEAEQEMAAKSRPVRLSFQGQPAEIEQVWRLDDQNGNPLQNAAFRQRFEELTADPHRKVARRVTQQLRDEGAEPAKVDIVASALAKENQEESRKEMERRSAEIGPALSRRAAELYKEAFFGLRDQVPAMMLEHDAMAWPKVAPRRYLKREEGALVVDLPAWSAVLIEVSWPEEGAARDD